MSALAATMMVVGFVAFGAAVLYAQSDARRTGGFLKEKKIILMPIMVGGWLLFGFGGLILSS